MGALFASPNSSDLMRRLHRDRLTRVAAGLQYNLDRDLFLSDSSGDIEIPVIPLSVCISPLITCNLRCRTCLSESGPGSAIEPWSTLYDVLEWMRPWAPVRLVWTGGEPTLYPELPQALRAAKSIGCHNVVCTNSAARDPCKDMAGDFFYSVSLYGIDRQSFLCETQCDSFSRFITTFEQLFRRNHKVVASIRVDQELQPRIPEYLLWLATYPIRKVTILNTRMRGRLAHEAMPLNAQQLKYLRQRVAELSLPFPTVFPTANFDHESRGGLIVIERSVNSRATLVVNGHPCLTFDAAGALVHGAIGGNGALFCSQDYVWNEP